MDTMKLLVDSHHGIYVPMVFAKTYIGWTMTLEDERILQEGPDNPVYWEAWDAVLGYASFELDGWVWFLDQNEGDLWAVREDHVWEEE